MILVRISAEDERIVRGAKSLVELQGAQALIVERIEQARALRAFKKAEPVEKKDATFGWKQALEIVKRELDNNVTVPPYPDRQWYQRLSTTIRTYAMDEEYVTKLARHAKANLRLPIKFDFLISQHARVLAGEWDRGAAPAAPQVSTAGWLKDRLPNE